MRWPIAVCQLDHYAIQDIETIEGLLYFDAAGQPDIARELP